MRHLRILDRHWIIPLIIKQSGRNRNRFINTLCYCGTSEKHLRRQLEYISLFELLLEKPYYSKLININVYVVLCNDCAKVSAAVLHLHNSTRNTLTKHITHQHIILVVLPHSYDSYTILSLPSLEWFITGPLVAWVGIVGNPWLTFS